LPQAPRDRHLQAMERTWADRLLPHVRYGMRALALAATKRGLRSWLDVGSLVIVEMPFELREVSPGEPPVVRMNASHVAAVARAFRRPEAELAARLARGDGGYVVIAEGSPVHMRWATTAPTAIPELGLWMCPAEGELYVYDAETVPGARGKRFPAAARAVMDGDFAARGFRRKLLYVRADNHAMWHALRTAPGPIRELYRLRYVRWGPGSASRRRVLVLGKYGPPVFARVEGA
jgi:hypothetical protein